MRRKVALGALALGLVGVIVVFLLVRAVVQQRAVSAIEKLLEGGDWGRITYSSLTVNMQLGITLRDAAYSPPDSAEPVLSAAEAQVSVSLWDLLRKRESVAVHVALESPRLQLTYLGGGNFDVSSLVRRLPPARTAEPGIHRLGMSFRKGKLSVALTPAARQELSEKLMRSARRGDQALADLLASTASRWKLVWSDALLAGTRDAVSGLIPPDIPQRIELEVSGNSSYEVGEERFTGRLKVASPFSGKVRFSASESAGFQLTATGIRLRPADLPFSLKPSKLVMLEDAEINIVRAVIGGGRDAARTLEAEVSAADLVLLPKAPSPIRLSKLSLELSPDEASASFAGAMGAGSISAKLSRGNGGSLDVDAKSIPVSELITSVSQVGAKALSLHLSGKRMEQESPSLDGELSLLGVSFRNESLADEFRLEGSLRQNFRCSCEVSRQGRKLLALAVSGKERKGKFNLKADLARKHIPASLTAGSPASEQLRALRGEARGSFDFDSRRLDMTVRNLTIGLQEAILTARQGSVDLVLPDSKGALIPSVNAALKSVTADFAAGRVAAPDLHFSASPKAFALSAAAASVVLPEATGEYEMWRQWLPSECDFSVQAFGKAKAGRWETAGLAHAKLATGKGTLTADVDATGTWPDLRVTASLTGFLDRRPLVADLTALRDGSTIAVERASADWGSSRMELAGNVNYQTRQLLLSYRFDGFEIGDFVPDRAVAGTVSSSGRISGSISEPVVTGVLQISRATVNYGTTSLPISNASSGFSLSEERLDLHGGSLQLAGQVVFLEGAISRRGLALSLWKDSFSPARMAAGTGSEALTDWEGQGELRLALSGSFDDLRYSGSYEQHGGALNQVALDEVRVRLQGDMHTLNLEEVLLRSGGGSFALSGTMSLAGEYPADWRLRMEDFPIELPSSLLPFGKQLALHGRVRGELSAHGELRRPQLAGNFELADASLLDTSFDRISLAFSSSAEGVRIDEFTAESEESFVTASGFWGYRPEDTLIDLEVPLLDISLFSPLMPPERGALEGELGIRLLVTEDSPGEPKVEGTFQSAGAEGLSLGLAHFDRIQGLLSYRRGVIELREVTLTADGSILEADGELPLPGSPQPLNIHLGTRDFSLAALRALLPLEGLDFSGGVSSELTVSGTWEHPSISGLAEIKAQNVSFEDRFRASRLLATIMVQDNQVESVHGRAFFAPAGKEDDAAPTESFLSFEGSGYYNPADRDFDWLRVEVDLSNLSRLQLSGFFEGGVDGELSLVREKRGRPYQLSGRLLVLKGASLRLARVAAPPDYLLERDVRLNLDVELQRSCNLRYPPMALEGEVFGRLRVAGSLSAPELDGELTASSGALMVYRHIVRLVESSTIAFIPANGLIPFVRGKAALELPGVLTSVTFDPAAGGVYLPSYVSGQAESLTIYMHLNNLLTPEGLNTIELSSDPPLPRETILSYLVGGPQGMVTQTGFESFLQTEALLYSSSRLSRFLEESLHFERFQIWTESTRDGTPLHLSVEKQLTPRFSLGYAQTFFAAFDERQEFSVKYLLYRRFDYKAYLELMQRYHGQYQNEFVANLAVNIKF